MTDDIDRTDEYLETWGELDGADLLDEVHTTATTYVAFADEHQPVAVTLWVAATHGLPAWAHATRLSIRSPQKRCGKSRLLDVIAGLVFKSFPCIDATTAAIFRSIGKDDHKTPTLLVDEADALWGTKHAAEGHEDLRALYNAGFQRNRPAWRCVGPLQIPTEFPTFAMVAFAGIGALPDTITDRAVAIKLKRRARGEKVKPFRTRRDEPPLHDLRDRLSSWVRDSERIKRLTDAVPTIPRGVGDRTADAWEPLLAIADEAGGDWPKLARAACRALSRQSSDDTDEGIQLLEDIRTIFTETGQTFLASAQLVRALKEIEESPWADEKDTLSVSKLAKKLKPFDVRPDRNSAGTLRGYRPEWFADPFSRYLPSKVSEPSETGSDQGKDDTPEPSDKDTSDVRSVRNSAVLTGLTSDANLSDTLDNALISGSDGLTLQTPKPRREGAGPLREPADDPASADLGDPDPDVPW